MVFVSLFKTSLLLLELPHSPTPSFPPFLPKRETINCSNFAPSLTFFLPHSLPSSLPPSLPPFLPSSLPPYLPPCLSPCLPLLPPCLPTSLPPSLPSSLKEELISCNFAPLSLLLPHSLSPTLTTSLPPSLSPSPSPSLPLFLQDLTTRRATC